MFRFNPPLFRRFIHEKLTGLTPPPPTIGMLNFRYVNNQTKRLDETSRLPPNQNHPVFNDEQKM